MKTRSKLFAVAIVCCALVLAFTAVTGCTSNSTNDNVPTTVPTTYPTQAQPSQTSSVTQMTIEVNEAAMGDGVGELIEDANMFNDLPYYGTTGYLVNYKITCDSLSKYKQESGYYFAPMSDIELIVDGESYSPISAVMPDGYKEASSGNMFKNGVKSGWAYFIAPASDNAYLRLAPSDVKSNNAPIKSDSRTRYKLVLNGAQVGGNVESTVKSADRQNKLPSDTTLSPYLIKYSVSCSELSSESYIQKNGDLFNPLTDFVLVVDGEEYGPTKVVLPKTYPEITTKRMKSGDIIREGYVYFIAPIGHTTTAKIKTPHSYSNEEKVTFHN